MDYICIEKLKNKHGKIVKYRLKDTSGKIFEASPDVLKNSIANGKVNVINLRLTSDHRLYSTSKTTNSTGLAHIIDIKYRVVDGNNNDCWYVDSNGFRYTAQQINELKNGARPRGLDGLQYRKGMKILLKYDKAKITNLSIIDPKLCIICEDSKSGKVFYERIIRAIYPNLKFDLYTSDGNLNIYNTVLDIEKCSNKYKVYIIISDNQMTNLDYRNNLKATLDFIKYSCYKIAYNFSPICVEEVLLSSPHIKLSGDTKCKELHSKIIDYLRSGNEYYTFDITNAEYSCCGERTTSLERLLYKQLNKNSVLNYTKDSISTCFFTQCCPMIFNGTSFATKCRSYNGRYITGTNMYNGVSLVCGLQNIINKILGYKNRYLTSWSKQSLEKLYS